uniref:Uncharacterized protein n=1 Tax=Rhizophora mucronata TaxID=61149 RepID=A0A2P2J394_RHIMU
MDRLIRIRFAYSGNSVVKIDCLFFWVHRKE